MDNLHRYGLFGVDRSLYPSRLAGEFILRDTVSTPPKPIPTRSFAGSGPYGGTGKPDMIVLNDEDYAVIIKEIDAYKQYFQQTNGRRNGTKWNSSGASRP
jgi:hypothetical protein